MQRHSLGSISVAALLMPGLVRADSGGFDLGIGFIVFYLFVCYLVACLFSIPLSLLLLGSKFKRITVGLVVPIIGIGLGALTEYWLERKCYLCYVNNDGVTVFIVVSSIPILFLFIGVIFSRAKAEAFERSRVQYAEYVEREKSSAKLVDANSRRANDT